MKFIDIKDLANQLDAGGAHKQADVVTKIMVKMAEEQDHEHGMFRRQLDKVDEAIEQIRNYVGDNEGNIKAWVQSLMTLGADYLDTVAHYLNSENKDGDVNVDLDLPSHSNDKEEEASTGERTSYAAKYQGKTVTLNKPFRTPGGPKKFSVYVKNDKGNIVKVNFGDPNMEIKRDDPNRRKNFRARHRCDNPGPKTKARYWACRTWEAGKSVTDITKGK